MAAGLRIKGHPIHPMLVPFPITLFIGTLACDIAYLATGLLFWYQAAYVAAGFGVAFGLLTALAGLFEYLTIPPKLQAKQTATIHMLVNLGAWALFLIGFVFRTATPGAVAIPEMAASGSALAAIVFLSFAGVALMTVGGWLGGHLVYVHGVGITQHAADARPITQRRVPVDQWTPRGPREDMRPPSSRDEAH